MSLPSNPTGYEEVTWLPWWYYEPDDFGWFDDPDLGRFTETPCGVCGNLGPCAYDADDRPMYHAQPDDD